MGVGFAPAVLASKLVAAIVRIACPGSAVITLVARSASCRTLVARADALSAFVVAGGPEPELESACLNAVVSRSVASCVVVPSCAATCVASAAASCWTIVSSEVPRSSCARICWVSSSVSWFPPADVAVAVDCWARAFPTSALSEPSSLALKSAPFLPASAKSEPEVECAFSVPCVCEPRESRRAVRFSLSPPFSKVEPCLRYRPEGAGT